MQAEVSPELETLDQLQGGDLPLVVVRDFFSDHDSFARGVAGLLAGGDVKLIHHGSEARSCEWTSLLSSVGQKDGPVLALTAQGAKRIA